MCYNKNDLVEVFVMNILVVDDEKEIADLIEIYLRNENFTVFKYYSSEEIMDDLDDLNIDLAILDVMIPNLDGFSLTQLIREKYNFPIIFLTAKIEDADKIHGLTLGADDYITKPFQPLELVARVKAQLRRYTRYNTVVEDDSSIIELRGLYINKDSHIATLNEENLKLTPIQFDILWHLMKHAGSVVATDELFQKVWKDKYFESDNNTVMVHIRHLREKMNDTNKVSKYIKTVWGVGYKIEK